MTANALIECQLNMGLYLKGLRSKIVKIEIPENPKTRKKKTEN